MNGDSVHQALRAWARGMYTTEAATELLIRAFDGRFARPGAPWVNEDLPHNPGRWWIDFDAIGDHIGVYSGGEQRLLRIVASLGSDSPDARISLGNDVSGIDSELLDLVLAAITHAAGHRQPWPR